MPRKSQVPLERKPVRLYEGDWERLKEYFPHVTPSVTIRNLVRNLLRELDKRTAEKGVQNDDFAVSIDGLDSEEPGSDL